MLAERIRIESVLGQGRGSVEFSRLTERIAAGAVFVYPTETIYGIGGCVGPKVEKRIFKAKRRPPANPMILVAGSLDHFCNQDLLLPPNAQRLAERFWPGKITLVVPTRDGQRTIGIRVTDNSFVSAVTEAVRQPLYSTSANSSGEAYDGSPDRIYETFKTSVDFMIDAGDLPKSSPSSVVQILADDAVEVLREGAVAKQDILDAIVN